MSMNNPFLERAKDKNLNCQVKNESILLNRGKAIFACNIDDLYEIRHRVLDKVDSTTTKNKFKVNNDVAES